MTAVHVSWIQWWAFHQRHYGMTSMSMSCRRQYGICTPSTLISKQSWTQSPERRLLLDKASPTRYHEHHRDSRGIPVSDSRTRSWLKFQHLALDSLGPLDLNWTWQTNSVISCLIIRKYTGEAIAQSSFQWWLLWIRDLLSITTSPTWMIVLRYYTFSHYEDLVVSKETNGFKLEKLLNHNLIVRIYCQSTAWHHIEASNVRYQLLYISSQSSMYSGYSVLWIC